MAFIWSDPFLMLSGVSIWTSCLSSSLLSGKVLSAELEELSVSIPLSYTGTCSVWCLEGSHVPVLSVAAVKGQAGILKTKIPLCGGNWMKVCMHLCHQMKGSAPPTHPLHSSARDRTVDLAHLWSDWMEPFSIFLLKWQRDLLQGWVVTWHMTFCELILCCNRFIGQSVSGKDLLFRTSLQQEHRQQSLWLAGFGLWTRLQWRWLYCAANWDHSLNLLLKPSSSHSPSCGFCPLFWHSIHHSSLVPSSLPTQPYHKVTVPLYPCSRGCVHCVSQPRAFLIVWDLLLRAPNSERASHCWVRKNLQLCQLYKIQGFLCLRFILSHLLGETMPLHS